MKVRKGLPGGQCKTITDRDAIKIPETSLRVFSEVGVQVNFPDARELFLDAGAKVDDTGQGNVQKILGKASKSVIPRRIRERIKGGQ